MKSCLVTGKYSIHISFIGDIKSDGKIEMLEFLQIFKGFPINEGIAWNASLFNKSEVFEKFPHIMLEFFLMEFKVTKIGGSNSSNALLVRFSLKNFTTFERTFRVVSQAL